MYPIIVEQSDCGNFEQINKMWAHYNGIRDISRGLAQLKCCIASFFLSTPLSRFYL